jgi:tRNA pseudouridine32 synthase/23S rRNA pseudouridine746 synthase/23S rRNA pseudouridine1911/1915/1917 synthase
MEFSPASPLSVIEALKKIYPDSSRRTLQNWLKAGRFSIDGSPVRKESGVLQPGQTLRSQETFRPPRVPGISVIYEDRYLIAIDKPVGLLSVPLDDGASKRHALGLLREHFRTDQIFAVHRIDRETSGVLLFARGKKTAEKLNEMFEAHDLKREYFAIVEGRLKEDRGTWQCPLLETPSFTIIESPEGKMAITHFEVIRRSAKYTYMKLILETGKKHQIRVHCKRAGHPVVGDKRYGARENPMRRLGLHAASLELIHPFTKKKIAFRSPLPGAFLVLGGRF